MFNFAQHRNSIRPRLRPSHYTARNVQRARKPTHPRVIEFNRSAACVHVSIDHTKNTYVATYSINTTNNGHEHKSRSLS